MARIPIDDDNVRADETQPGQQEADGAGDGGSAAGAPATGGGAGGGGGAAAISGARTGA